MPLPFLFPTDCSMKWSAWGPACPKCREWRLSPCRHRPAQVCAQERAGAVVGGPSFLRLQSSPGGTRVSIFHLLSLHCSREGGVPLPLREFGMGELGIPFFLPFVSGIYLPARSTLHSDLHTISWTRSEVERGWSLIIQLNFKVGLLGTLCLPHI